MRKGLLRLALATAIGAVPGSAFADMITDLTRDIEGLFSRTQKGEHWVVDPTSGTSSIAPQAAPRQDELTICAAKRSQISVLDAEIGFCNAGAVPLSLIVLNGDVSQVLTLSRAELTVVKVDGGDELLGLIESGGIVRRFRLVRKQHYTVELQNGGWVIAQN